MNGPRGLEKALHTLRHQRSVIRGTGDAIGALLHRLKWERLKITSVGEDTELNPHAVS